VNILAKAVAYLLVLCLCSPLQGLNQQPATQQAAPQAPEVPKPQPPAGVTPRRDSSHRCAEFAVEDFRQGSQLHFCASSTPRKKEA
jgi:hypothetical protein